MIDHTHDHKEGQVSHNAAHWSQTSTGTCYPTVGGAFRTDVSTRRLFYSSELHLPNFRVNGNALTDRFLPPTAKSSNAQMYSFSIAVPLVCCASVFSQPFLRHDRTCLIFGFPFGAAPVIFRADRGSTPRATGKCGNTMVQTITQLGRCRH